MIVAGVIVCVGVPLVAELVVIVGNTFVPAEHGAKSIRVFQIFEVIMAVSLFFPAVFDGV